MQKFVVVRALKVNVALPLVALPLVALPLVALPNDPMQQQHMDKNRIGDEPKPDLGKKKFT